MLTPAYAAEEGLASPDIQEATLNNGTEKLPDEQNIPKLTGPVILDVSVQGNVEVVTEHIMSIITSKAGEPVDEERLRKDAEAIFELGFFIATDYRVTDKADGVDVLFLVQENPVVSKINFEGNTVYPDEKLEEMIFTKPGMIFNRTFFRNDLQRIREKYQEDGYVMANVGDVRIEGTEITVLLVEPKISQIVIQGNKITKTHIVRRYLKIKEGELFNSNKLRLSLSRLQGVGFFSDVNVNFEPDQDPNDVIVVLTVEEGRTGKLGFNIAYGTQSGFGGGLSYENSNIGGKGMKLSAGFDLGDREEYWLSYEQPYMGGKVTAWKIGAYKRSWSDLRYYIDDEEKFNYDRDKTGAFFGFGRKFKEESIYNWYLLFDWHEVKNDPDNPPAGFEKSNWGNIPIDDKNPPTTVLDDLGDGTYYSATASVRRLNIDEYLPYSKGDVQTLNVQYGQADVEGKDYSYFKYWLEAKFYFTVEKLFKDFFETSLSGNSDRPIIFASRILAGSSSGDVPYEQMYTVGGDTTLRGYDDDRYHGEEMLLGNFELRVPMDKNFTLVAFYDIGRAWRKEGDTASFGSDMGSSPGFGVRINTPLGNLRLDYATGDEGRFHFGFGELF
jgi:outer membrane protein insertion porin family